VEAISVKKGCMELPKESKGFSCNHRLLASALVAPIYYWNGATHIRSGLMLIP